MILIDTSIWIFALRKKFIPEVKEKVSNLLAQDLVAINGIIKLELLIGARGPQEFIRLKKYLDSLYEIKIESSVLEKSYEIAYHLCNQRVIVPSTDIIIAASAICTNFVLLHADKHFDIIAKYTDLKAESFLPLISKTNK